MRDIFKFKSTKYILSVTMSAITLAILIIGNAGTAFADGGGNLSPTINAGALGVTNASSPSITSSVNLDGSDKSLTIALPLTLTDATGSGNGWKIQLVTTQFHQAVDASPFHTLPTNATTFTGVTGVACGSNSTCQLPTNSVSSVTVPVQSATTDGTTISYGTATATSFYNAAANTGMGITNLSAGFNVALPANTTYAGGYSSNFTVTVVSAP